MPKSKEKIFIKESELKQTQESEVFSSKENLDNFETEKFIREENKQNLKKDQLKKNIIAEKHNTLSPEKQEKQPVVIIPVDKKTYEKGLKKTPNSSLRWLAEWCRRLMKMSQFVFQNNQKNGANNKINNKIDNNFQKKIIKIIFPILIFIVLFYIANYLISL